MQALGGMRPPQAMKEVAEMLESALEVFKALGIDIRFLFCRAVGVVPILVPLPPPRRR